VSRDRAGATRAFLELRAQGEALPRLIPLIARRLREVLALAVRLEAGETPSQIKASLKMGSWMADRRLKEARASDADQLRRGLEALAELELASRGMADVARGDRGAAGHRRHRGVAPGGRRRQARADGAGARASADATGERARPPDTCERPLEAGAEERRAAGAAGGALGLRASRAGARRGTSCGRPCCGAARRA
jgi:hypothetical protein